MTKIVRELSSTHIENVSRRGVLRGLVADRECGAGDAFAGPYERHGLHAEGVDAGSGEAFAGVERDASVYAGVDAGGGVQDWGDAGDAPGAVCGGEQGGGGEAGGAGDG